MALARQHRLRIVYFGMMGPFSCRPLEALLSSGYAVQAIVVPRLENRPEIAVPATPVRLATKSYRLLPQLAPPSLCNLRQIARRESIPLLEVGSLRSAEIQAGIAAYQPDAICVACFSHRLPIPVLRIPRLGCLNIHPSLLPDNRGPDPLFWTFRRGDSFTGSTIHLMDEGFDSGPVLLQERVEVLDGIAERELEEELATCGAELLIQALAGLATGTIQPIAQDSMRATHYPLPDHKDLVITPEHSARWAYNFASGLHSRLLPILIQVKDRTFHLVMPLDFDNGGIFEWPWKLDGEILTLSCAPGVFRARVAS